MKKKFTVFILLAVMMSALVLPTVLAGCQAREEVLKVYNWSEYIGEDIIERFEEYYHEVTGKT